MLSAKLLSLRGGAPLESITSTRPLELVCIDFWSAEDSRNKSVDVLVITDHFTRMAQAFPCRDQTAKRVARVLWDRYFCVFGFPERIHSDQGANFESELISELLRVSGVKKSHTTPYHPMGNGSVERFNRTLGGMIRALSPAEKADWPQRLQTLTFMYNCTVHETTGYAPFYLMFGRVPRLPVDVIFQSVLHDAAVTCYDKYVARLADDLKAAMVIAREHAVKEQNRHALLYNRKVKGSKVEIGDRVLLANRKERGKKKLADRWESTIYTVVDMAPETHTYRIRDTLTGREKVVHRNLLMLVNFLPDAVDMPDHVSSEPDTDCSFPGTPDVGETGSVARSRAGACPDTASSSNSSVAVGEHLAPLTGLGSVDSEGRTFDWVSQLSAPTLSETSDDDVAGLASDPGVSLASPTTDLTDPIETPAVDVRQTVPVLDTVTVTGAPSDTLCPVDQTSCALSSRADAPLPVRSRFGRFIKPVTRLIQTMSRQDVVQDKFNVKAVCESVFQAIAN